MIKRDVADRAVISGSKTPSGELSSVVADAALLNVQPPPVQTW